MWSVPQLKHWRHLKMNQQILHTLYIIIYNIMYMHYLMRKFYSERDCFRTSETWYSILANLMVAAESVALCHLGLAGIVHNPLQHTHTIFPSSELLISETVSGWHWIWHTHAQTNTGDHHKRRNCCPAHWFSNWVTLGGFPCFKQSPLLS